MDYDRLHKRIDDMLKYESDNYLVNINLKKEISDKLYDYQHFHIFNLLTAFRSHNILLDGSDTGTGKTYTAIAICKQLNLKPLIITPKTIIPIWKDVCNYFKVKPLLIINYELVKNGKCYYIECINVDNKNNKYIYNWKLPRNSIIIFDEVHRCKNYKSKNGQLLMSTLKCPKVLMLSATVSDTPKTFNIFGYMLGFYKNLRRGRNWINGMLREDNNYVGTTVKVSAINKNIYPYRGSRMKIIEIGNKFPKNQIVAECYYLDKDKQIEVNSSFDQIYMKMNILKGNKSGILADIIKARQKIELLKIPIIIDLVNQYLENNYSVVIFINFIKTLECLKKEFSNCCIVHGTQTIDERKKNISLFQENKSNVIICNIKIQEGISLHDKYGIPRVSIISPSFSSIDLKQSLGRIHRADSKTPALQRIVYCANTCEEIICKKVKAKLEFISKLNDDDLISIY